MVYGESKSEFRKGSKYRECSLCKEKVKETMAYDHVGIKNCLFHDYKPRTEERLSKGRRSFNAITNVGIKKKGISMKVCSTLFWTIIAPIVTGMYDEIKMLGRDAINNSLNVAQNSFHVLLGKQPADVQIEDMIELCLISGKYITRIYESVTSG